MKKLFKFLSLALASISLSLPSACALEPIDESVLESMSKDSEVIKSYAKKAYEEYGNLKSEGKLNELRDLKIEIASAMWKLAEKDAEYNKTALRTVRHNHGRRDCSVEYVSKLSACFALNLLNLFEPSATGNFELEELKEGSTFYSPECVREGAPLKINLVEKSGYVIKFFDIK